MVGRYKILAVRKRNKHNFLLEKFDILLKNVIGFKLFIIFNYPFKINFNIFI